MNTFAKAFTKTASRTVSENGAVVEQTTGNPVLDFNHKVVRSTTPEEIKKRISEIMLFAQSNNDVQVLHDLFVVLFHKRNPRGGEGEKTMVYNMILELYEYYPKTICQMVHLLADFGYYKDFYQIWERVCQLIDTEMKTGDKSKVAKYYYQKYNPLISEIIKYTIQQRNSDLDTLNKNGTSISLLGKWIPREGSHFAKSAYWFITNKEGMLLKKSLVDMLINELANQAGVSFDTERKYPSYWYKKYRTGNTILNKKLDTPEIAMCASRYSDIKFEHVASRAMAKYRKAFMNEKIKVALKPYEEATGNRFPDKEDRVKARNNLKTLLESKTAEKLKATTLEPHEIINKIITPSISTMDKQILTQMWESKKQDVGKHLQEILEQLKDTEHDLGNVPRPGKIIPMVDTSESMTWNQTPNPLMVAISLGIMTAELHENTSPFKDMLISFTDIPTRFKLRPEQSLADRYGEVNSRKGYNTNFRLAMEELLKLCIENNVKEEDIPDLLVFTDGQFDAWGPRARTTSIQTHGHWQTHHTELMLLWGKAGYTKIPRIIYWNLRGGTPGVQTDAYHPGVQMLQGFSPNLIKFVLYGESFEDTYQNVTIEGKEVKMKVSSVTPWDTFRSIVDQSRYDIIRIILNDSDEKMLKNYCYKPAINEQEFEQESECESKSSSEFNVMEISNSITNKVDVEYELV